MKKIYLIIKYAKNKKVKAYILDLSRSGIGFAAIHKMKKGTNIEITPKIKLLPELHAEIIYASKIPRKNYNYRTGARFINLDEKQYRFLDKFIKKIIKKKRVLKR